MPAPRQPSGCPRSVPPFWGFACEGWTRTRPELCAPCAHVAPSSDQVPAVPRAGPEKNAATAGRPRRAVARDWLSAALLPASLLGLALGFLGLALGLLDLLLGLLIDLLGLLLDLLGLLGLPLGLLLLLLLLLLHRL